MGDTYAHSSLTTRAIIASVVACLFALQLLIMTGAPNFAAGSQSAGICAAHGGDKNPGHGHDDHCQCCAFCAANRQDASLFFIGALISVKTYLIPETIVSAVRLFAGDPDGRPIGWTSSWSSRAPPPTF
jgi:hypothetical protein